MSTILNRIKGVMVVTFIGLLGLLGIELGQAGGSLLYDDLEFVFGKRQPDIYRVNAIGFRKFEAVDAYDRKRVAKIYWDKKAKTWRACKHQPKGYTKEIRNLGK